jgi:hypothetical protein
MMGARTTAVVTFNLYLGVAVENRLHGLVAQLARGIAIDEERSEAVIYETVAILAAALETKSRTRGGRNLPNACVPPATRETLRWRNCSCFNLKRSQPGQHVQHEAR